MTYSCALTILIYIVDNNTIAVTSDNLTVLLKTIEIESELAVDWFKQNEITVNSKFQAVILNKTELSYKIKITSKLNVASL